MIITKNVTLTARWLGGGAEERTQFTVSFNTNGGAPTVIPDVTVDSGFPLDTRFPTNPTRQGTVDEYHTFEGWFDGEEQYTASTRITKNVTLTARWTTHERGTFDVEMVFVQGGTFRMGCTIEQLDECWDYEKPAHNVNLSGFYIGKYPVTQRLWKQVMNGDDPSSFKGDDLPVETVSWDDVQVFITNLNNLTQRQYRLPTEAEWEYAARGGRESRGYKYAGSDDIDEVAWYDENSGWTTQPVGTKAPNELGIYDMSGNVWEWVNDWWGEYPEADSRTDPRGPSSGSGRVVRGGSWDSGARICRVSYRSTDAPDSRSYNIGFRLALSPP
jgi:formylglycine-generating enzyme required for sulfatase activity